MRCSLEIPILILSALLATAGCHDGVGGEDEVASEGDTAELDEDAGDPLALSYANFGDVFCATGAAAVTRRGSRRAPVTAPPSASTSTPSTTSTPTPIGSSTGHRRRADHAAGRGSRRRGDRAAPRVARGRGALASTRRVIASTPMPSAALARAQTARSWLACAALALLIAPILVACTPAPPSAGEQDRQAEPAPVPKDPASPDPILPGLTGDPALQARLDASLAAKGPAYTPRTHHLRDDGRPRYTNRLIDEASPYLLQHAHNPVNWFPWGEEAFERALPRETSRCFLSVGYSDLPLVPRDGARVLRGRGDRAPTSTSTSSPSRSTASSGRTSTTST